MKNPRYYITYLIRLEYDSFGICSGQKIMAHLIGESSYNIGDFRAQVLSLSYVYKTITVPYTSEGIRDFNAYAQRRGFIWASVPVVA